MEEPGEKTILIPLTVQADQCRQLRTNPLFRTDLHSAATPEDTIDLVVIAWSALNSVLVLRCQHTSHQFRRGLLLPIVCNIW
jgi:hypothetical protein